MSDWINVNDRLPEMYTETVMVARKQGSLVPNVTPAVHDGESFKALTVGGLMTYVEPTHWKPLPEPPEEQE